MKRVMVLIVILTPSTVRAAADAEALKQFRGRWRIAELTDNGSVVLPPYQVVIRWADMI